jgi:hypothetical protein
MATTCPVRGASCHRRFCSSPLEHRACDPDGARPPWLPRPSHNTDGLPPISPLTVAVEVDRNLIVALRPEAARRDTTVPDLVNRLLAVTVEDKLTTAILDDQP